MQVWVWGKNARENFGVKSSETQWTGFMICSKEIDTCLVKSNITDVNYYTIKLVFLCFLLGEHNWAYHAHMMEYRWYYIGTQACGFIESETGCKCFLSILPKMMTRSQHGLKSVTFTNSKVHTDRSYSQGLEIILHPQKQQLL